MPSTSTLPAFFSAKAWYCGSSLRHGVHQLAHRLITIGPRTVDSSRGFPP